MQNWEVAKLSYFDSESKQSSSRLMIVPVCTETHIEESFYDMHV
jgi:hypothetical protein